MADSGFGESVAVSGNTVVVGAPEATVGANIDQGAAYLFTESGPGWANMTQVAKLTVPDGAAGDLFGWSVSIRGNTVVVGAPGATIGGKTGQGAAYVFTEPATGWTDATQNAKLTASDGAAGDCFGMAVSISGNTVVVGACFVPSFLSVGNQSFPGAAYVFTQPGGGWDNMTQTAETHCVRRQHVRLRIWPIGFDQWRHGGGWLLLATRRPTCSRSPARVGRT